MQFVVIAYDHKNGGLKRRLAARDRHVALGDKMKADGNYHMGAALLDEKGQMTGSIIILDYPSRKELDEWLKNEPYVTEKVWEKIEIIPCKVGPTFTIEKPSPEKKNKKLQSLYGAWKGTEMGSDKLWEKVTKRRNRRKPIIL